ncbi:phage tail protein [Streptomyces sp. NBC_01565]|uniref:phage tail protein n=1 Tax=unclassified Streptomyces TaxID=2593676 RepID=UPI002252F4B5|nr:phage tail protein [Streptomyces sp. NBC_01565]MCX4545582.1 phage tail protein [Streptomyces sp. NBC_01565]
MSESSYLRYLPPVLWEDEPEDAGFSLGSALCVFEKILTGIPDDVPVLHEKHTPDGDESHAHLPIGELIARVDRLFDPWTTPPEFLPWLASWVSLRFPELQGLPLWDEYQRRKATAEIGRIHRRRGLRTGLNALMDLHAVGRVRPRVALDDGSCLLLVHLEAGVPAPVSSLATFRPVVEATAGVVREGLLCPCCVAQGSDGSLFVGDRGLPEALAFPHRRRVWRLGPAGQPDFDGGSPPLPRPLVPGQDLRNVIGVAVRPATAGQPETLFVLDQSGRIFSVPAPYTADSATPVTKLSDTGPVFPLAMAIDDKGDLLVLDRRLPPGEAATPRVFVVRPAPAAVTVNALDPAFVKEPLSLFVDGDGSLLVGDGGDQQTAPPPGSGGGNLVRVVRSATAAWAHSRLLPPQNPLVAPTAVVRAGPDRLYVLDVGLKPYWPAATESPFILRKAVPACVHLVETGSGPATTLQVSEPGQFVSPTGMATQGEHLVICDPGQIGAGAGLDDYRCRIQPFDINVIVHFTEADLSADRATRKREVSQAVGMIKSAFEQHKPAHCRFSEVTRTDV